MKVSQKILMYHSVGATPAGQEAGAQLYNVSEDNFRNQIECIARGAKEAALTFDDGLLNNYRFVFPVLKEFKLRAYFFIIVTRVGTRGYMSWSEIKELKNGGMRIGSHGMSHRILTELNDLDLEYELRESKKILEENLGCVIEYFSIPRGFYDQKVIAKARETGYKAAFTSNPRDSGGFLRGRIPVKSNWSLKHFRTVLNNGLSLKDRIEELLKASSKKILGARYYNKLRTAILKPNSTS